MKLEICDEFFYRVKENNEDLFAKFDTSKENLLRNNNNIKVYAGEWVKIKINNYKTHYVKPIETIKQIAEIYNTSIARIMEDNNLKTDKLFIGQKLKIYQ